MYFVLFLVDVERRIGGEVRRGMDAVGLRHVDDDAQDHDDDAVGDDLPAAAVHSVEAVDRAAQGGEIRDLGFPPAEMFRFLQRRYGEHGEQVGDEIDHDSQIDEDIELLQQGRADGGHGEDRLEGDQRDDRHIRRTETIYFREERREMAERRAVSDDFGDGELPCRKGNEAGADEHAGDDERSGVAEHGRIGEAERRFGADELFVRNETADDRRGDGVDESRKKGACQDGNGHIAGRIFHRFRIGAGRFKAEESPENDRDGVAHGDGEGKLLGIPGSFVDRRVKEIPAREEKARHRSQHTGDAHSGEASRFFRPAEADGGGQHEDADRGEAYGKRRQMQAEEVGRITDDARRDGNIGNDEGDRVGVIGQEISDPAEAVFRVAAHAAALRAVHAAHGERVGEERRAERGEDPRENGYCSDLRQLGRQKDNTRTHHVDRCDCCELYHSHFFALGQWISLLSHVYS